MIKIEKNVVGILESNSWIVYGDESKNCLIIDLGGDFLRIFDRIRTLGLKPSALLLTHGHFDHTACAAKAHENGIPVYISERDAYMLDSAASSLATAFGVRFEPLAERQTVREGVYEIGGFSVEVIETPGHTAGSVCYKIGDGMFCGDTVFKYGYGRYDLPTGSFADLQNSFKKLAAYSALRLYCGHGDDTSLEEEKKYNPMFR